MRRQSIITAGTFVTVSFLSVLFVVFEKKVQSSAEITLKTLEAYDEIQEIEDGHGIDSPEAQEAYQTLGEFREQGSGLAYALTIMMELRSEDVDSARGSIEGAYRTLPNSELRFVLQGSDAYWDPEVNRLRNEVLDKVGEGEIPSVPLVPLDDLTVAQYRACLDSLKNRHFPQVGLFLDITFERKTCGASPV